MLFTENSAGEKRAALRTALDSGRLLRFPGAFSPFVALMIERQGFDGVYVSGGALAAELGLPDIALTTLTEVSGRGRQIARVTDLPAIIDADTGFGEAMNAARTVREMEELGLAGCHFEDQESPKRCGHLDNKALITTEHMVQKIRAAVSARRDSNFLVIARTDSRASEGLEAAIARCKAYVDAGADVIFPEALQDAREFEAVRKALAVPLLANMTEFGKTRLMTTGELADLGFNIVIWPVTGFRLAMKAVEDGLARIDSEGTQEPILDAMQPRARLYEILRYADYERYDQSVFDFRL